MKNIHVLPTDKPSSIWINYVVKRLIYGQFTSNDTKINCQNQNIYITSDEYIGLSYYLDGSLVRKGVVDDKDYWKVRKDCKKIILTTDQDLIKDGVQPITDKFLEWFVKNPSCEEIEVNKKRDKWLEFEEKKSFIYKYKIIIPKEETEKETLEEVAEKYATNHGMMAYVFPEKKESFIEGAKWQKEQDKNKYSEEDMRKMYDFGSIGHFTENESLEQFKKK